MRLSLEQSPQEHTLDDEIELSRAADAYLRIVYRCAHPADLPMAERREVALGAAAGRRPFVELARALPPDPELAVTGTSRARGSGAHPGATPLARTTALAALAAALLLWAPPAQRPLAVVVALVGIVDASLSARRMLAFFAGTRRCAIGLGVVGLLAGVALLAAGVWLASGAADAHAGRRDPLLALGAYFGGGLALLLAAARWLHGELGRS